jgi:hypothetical protein
MATLKKHFSFVCSECCSEYGLEVPKCLTCGVTFTVEALNPSHNSAMDAICAIASQTRACRWSVGSSGCSSLVECPHKRHQ